MGGFGTPPERNPLWRELTHSELGMQDGGRAFAQDVGGSAFNPQKSQQNERARTHSFPYSVGASTFTMFLAILDIGDGATSENQKGQQDCLRLLDIPDLQKHKLDKY